MIVVATPLFLFIGLLGLATSGVLRGIADLTGMPARYYETLFHIGRLALVVASFCVGFFVNSFVGATGQIVPITAGMLVPLATILLVFMTNLPNRFAARAHIDAWHSAQDDTFMGQTDFVMLTSGALAMMSPMWLLAF